MTRGLSIDHHQQLQVLFASRAARLRLTAVVADVEYDDNRTLR